MLDHMPNGQIQAIGNNTKREILNGVNKEPAINPSATIYHHQRVPQSASFHSAAKSCNPKRQDIRLEPALTKGVRCNEGAMTGLV